MELTSVVIHSFIMGEINLMPIIQIASFRSMPSYMTFLQINTFFLCVLDSLSAVRYAWGVLITHISCIMI